jgi:hypothetical protein
MAEGNGQNGSARWAGVVVTVVLAAGAMTIQWGVVTTKLQQVEKRLDEFIGEARSIRAQYAEMERKIWSLEGMLCNWRAKRPVVYSGSTIGFPSAPTVRRHATAPLKPSIRRIAGLPDASTSMTTEAFPDGPSSTTDGQPFEFALSVSDCLLDAP